MNYEDYVLMNEEGNFVYQGIVAKPFQHHSVRSNWLIIVGEVEKLEHKAWTCIRSTSDVKTICLEAIDWYKESVNQEKKPQDSDAHTQNQSAETNEKK